MKSDNVKKYIYDLVTPVLLHSFVDIKINCTVKLQNFLELYLSKGVGICFEMGYHIFDPHRSI